MNSAPDITGIALFWGGLLLLIPLLTSLIFKLGLVRELVVATGRMGIQLWLAGLFLTYIFNWDSIPLNFCWVLVMIGVAMGTVLKRSALDFRQFAGATFAALAISILGVVLFFNILILHLPGGFEARYFIILSGMLLGNSLRGNIIGMTHFYHSIHRDIHHLQYYLGTGATLTEALQPYLQESLRRALQPTLATMATVGIVALPGMMSGQILGGSSPLLAIKYQIAIMVAIFAAMNLSLLLTLLLTTKTAFDHRGNLKPGMINE